MPLGAIAPCAARLQPCCLRPVLIAVIHPGFHPFLLPGQPHLHLGSDRHERSCDQGGPPGELPGQAYGPLAAELAQAAVRVAGAAAAGMPLTLCVVLHVPDDEPGAMRSGAPCSRMHA